MFVTLSSNTCSVITSITCDLLILSQKDKGGLSHTNNTHCIPPCRLTVLGVAVTESTRQTSHCNAKWKDVKPGVWGHTGSYANCWRTGAAPQRRPGCA